MTFKVQPPLDGYLHMTMGLTQPVAEGEKAYPWEFSVRTVGNQEWASDLLYQLLTHWHLEDRRDMVRLSLAACVLHGSRGQTLVRND